MSETDITMQCNVAESGWHEPDFERLAYYFHLNGEAGLFRTTCLHCTAIAEFRIDPSDAHWSNTDEDEIEED